MYQFFFSLKFNKAIDLFYEYVIARCREYFNIPNKGIVFRINYNQKEKSLLIAVFCDCTRVFLNNLSDENFSFTKSTYESLTISDIEQKEISVIGNELCLPENEVRYIKFSQDTLAVEMCKMFCDMSNEYLKIDKHNAKFNYDSTKQEFVYRGYVSKYNKHWGKRKNTNIDISNVMKEFYI